MEVLGWKSRLGWDGNEVGAAVTALGWLGWGRVERTEDKASIRQNGRGTNATS